MHYRQTITTIDQTFTAAEKLGVKIPKTLDAERRKLADLGEKVRQYDVKVDLPAAVLASLDAGNEPTTDPTVLEAITRGSLFQAGSGLEFALSNRAGSFAHDHADELLDLFADPFKRAAESIEKATEQLGDVSLDDTAAILSQAGDAAVVWAAAQNAVSTIDTIEKTRKVLGLLARHLEVPQRYQLLAVADVPADVFLDEQLAGTTLGPWDIARRGWTLSLATPDELSRRIEAVTGGQVQRSAVDADAFRKAYQATHGMARL